MDLKRIKAKLSKQWSEFKKLKDMKGDEKHAKCNAKMLKQAALNVAKGEKRFLDAWLAEKNASIKAAFNQTGEMYLKRGTRTKDPAKRVQELLRG